MLFARTTAAFLAVALTSVAVAPAAVQPPAGGLDELRALAAAGRHAEAVAAADALLAADGLWEFAYDKLVVAKAHLGRRYGYFEASSTQTVEPMVPVADRHQVPADPAGSPYANFVTCVDLSTGRRLWTRMFRYETMHAGIDPRDDGLWVWTERHGEFQQVDAATGDTRRTGKVPKSPVAPAALESLRDGDAEIWARTTPNTQDPLSATQYDVNAGTAKEGVLRPFARSRDGRRRVYVGGANYDTVVTCHPVGDKPNESAGRELWRIEERANSRNQATWVGDDVLIPVGSSMSPGVVLRVDGATGTVRWRAALDAFAFEAGGTQLRGGTYAAGGWVPVGTVGDEVWAIDLAHRVRFFAAGTGEPTRTIEVGRPLVAPPRFADDGTVVFATVDGMKSGRWDAGRRPPRGEVVAVKFRSLVALGRAADALAAAQAAAKSVPGEAAWDALADAMAATGEKPEHVAAARVRAMAAGGRAASPDLRASHGLVWRVPTGPVYAPPLLLGDVALVVQQDGTVLEVDLAAGRVVGRSAVPVNGFASLRVDGQRIVAAAPDGRESVYRQLDGPPPPCAVGPPPIAPREEMRDPAGVDRAWFAAGGGHPQRVHGRLVRSTKGGGVRELVDGKVVDRPGNVPALVDWKFSEIDGGPTGREAVAAGPGGVYAVDDSLRPHRQIVDLGPPRREAGQLPTAILVAGDDRTLAVVGTAATADGWYLQVRSRDGQREVRPPARVQPSRDNPEWQPLRLTALDGGYLYAGGELAYFPADPARPAWRFGLLTADPPRYDPFATAGGAQLGEPRVCGNRVVVAARNGGLFVFDLAAVRGR